MTITRTTTDQWTANKMGIPLSELSQEQLEAWQLEAFRETVAYAQTHSRFYREHFKGVHPEEIRSLEDLQSLPTISEADLAGNESSFLCVNPGEVCRVVTVPTTGTSGNRKRLSFTTADLRSSMDFILTGFLMLCERGDRMLIMMSGTAEGSIGDVVQRTMSQMQVDVKVHGSVSDIADAYKKLCEYKPNVIVAIPHQAAALARYGQQFGNPEKTWIRSVLLSADDIPESICRRLRTLWECSTFRHYGMTEMGIAGGVECPGQDGYHLRACDLMFEILEPDEQGFGEIALTTLRREAMPLIRYRTGDIGRFTTDSCPCGSPLTRIAHIQGRRRNMISVEGTNIPLSALEDAVFSIPECIDLDCTFTQDERLLLTVHTLPGDTLSVERIKEELSAFMEKVRVEIDTVASTHLLQLQGPKKTVRRL